MGTLLHSGLSAQFIMRASLARHIRDITRLDDSWNTSNWQKPDYQKRFGESEVDNLNWYQDYAEPGYSMSHGDRGILTANWNYFHRGITDLLERAGFECEWPDEWTDCQSCNKLVRTQGDSYTWQPYWVWHHGCEVVCLDCVDWPDYLESIEDDPNKACVRKCNPADHRYTLISESREFENGLHPGQNDDPKKILAKLQEQSKEHIIFRISESSQFYITFEVWQKQDSK